MTNLFNEIQEIKEAFSLNLDDHTAFNNFEQSKGLLWNFKKYFLNNKTPIYFLLGLSLQANANALDNFDYQNYLKETIDKSNQILNSYYREDLPEISPEIIKEAILKEKDFIAKNPFWNGNVLTVIFKTVDSDIYSKLKEDVNKQTANQINFVSNQSIFFNRPTKEQEYINNFLNGYDDYFYPVTIYPNELIEVAQEFSSEFKELVIYSIIYHEAAHASFEQTISNMKVNYSGNMLNLEETLYSESHSDIAGVWMAARQLNVPLESFIRYLDEYIKFRSNMIENKDYDHLTSVPLLEFKSILKNNSNIYNEIPLKQISVMSALITDYSTSKDYNIQLKDFLSKNKINLNNDFIYQNLIKFKENAINRKLSSNLEKIVYKLYLREQMIEKGYRFENRQEEIELAFEIGEKFLKLDNSKINDISAQIFSKYFEKNIDMLNIVEYLKVIDQNIFNDFINNYNNKELNKVIVKKNMI